MISMGLGSFRDAGIGRMRVCVRVEGVVEMCEGGEGGL